MANVRIDAENNAIVVEMEGLDKLWALRSSLSIPLANVRGATADPGVLRESKGTKVAGSNVPGLIRAGTFHVDGEWVFWDVHDSARAVVIELVDERYARLVVEVDDPRTTVDLVERSIAH
jgi:hypothetical protein